MAITAKDVMELRKQTDCGMMECKKALTQADGDFEKAIEILREQGLAAANKKAGRIAAEGMVYAVSFDNCAVVVEVNAETDFVAKNDKFVDFTKNLAKVVADENPADVEALMACKMGDGTVDDALKALILVIKENIKVRRFARYEGHCAAYVHGGGTHGVIVKFETSDDVAAKPEFAAFGKDIAMQVAAANPSYLNESDVPEDVLAKEKEIVLAQMANDPKTANKPDAIKEKMAIGKLGKFYKEACLVDQAFIKDGGMDVKKYVADTAKALGGDIKIALETWGSSPLLQKVSLSPPQSSPPPTPPELACGNGRVYSCRLAAACGPEPGRCKAFHRQGRLSGISPERRAAPKHRGIFDENGTGNTGYDARGQRHDRYVAPVPFGGRCGSDGRIRLRLGGCGHGTRRVHAGHPAGRVPRHRTGRLHAFRAHRAG